VKSQIRGHLVAEALSSLRPLSQYAVGSDGSINWIDTVQTQPTQSQIDAEIVRLQVQYDALEYARKRQPEYPPLTDLADALYHQSKGDETKLTAYLAKCEAVKQKYPKE
jgi:hypothetical protein